MNEKIKLLKELYLKNKLSHAVLIETNNQNFCVEELLDLVKVISCEDATNENHKDCALCNMIDKKEGINFFIIEPDGKNIKKEQMIELRNNCSKIPIISKNNVYIIKNAEKFNNSSANTILKFIEEPYDNCFGFFITNSKDNIINTIRSRCEIYNIRFKSKNFIDENNIDIEKFNEIKNDVLEYLIEISKKNNIIVNKDVLKVNYKNKIQCKIFFEVMLDVIDNYINLLLKKEEKTEYDEFSFLKSDNLYVLMRKKNIIINILNNMSYNLNIDLVFDKFVIEMGEIDE